MSDRATRQRIVEAADRLFYERGYERTSFADIAGTVRISRGNFYHHFPTKDGILEAVIERRLEATRGMLARWESEGKTPAERLVCFVHILIANRAKIELYGCPVGTLNAELAKLEHASRAAARGLFDLFRDWLRARFEELGRTDDADALAMRLLAESQGIAALASAYRDATYVDREVARLQEWIQDLRETTK